MTTFLFPFGNLSNKEVAMSGLTRDEEFEIITDNLGSITSLRRFAKQKDFSWLLGLQDKLSAIIDERKEEEELLELERQEIEKKKAKLLELAEEMGIDPTSISFEGSENSPTSKKARTQKVAKPKYRFIDPQTQKEETWTGIGRMKNGLKLLIDQGRKLEEFLIDKNENIQS